jgi:hypothetical protein
MIRVRYEGKHDDIEYAGYEMIGMYSQLDRNMWEPYIFCVAD